MKDPNNRKRLAWLFLLASLVFFVMGFSFPLLQTGYGIGPIIIKQNQVYLWSSFQFFFSKGEIFIGMLLLFFTLVFPACKYLFLFITLTGIKLPQHYYMSIFLEIINKWAMLDVFVVALLILNMKFDSAIIISNLQDGTTLFAISIVLMMACSFITGKWLAAQNQAK